MQASNTIYHKTLVLLLCGSIILFTMIQVSVPAVAAMELLLGDLLLVVTLLVVLNHFYLKKEYIPLLVASFLFLLLQVPSFVKSKSVISSIILTVPLVHQFILVLTFLAIFSKVVNFKAIRNALFIILFLSGLPIYLELLVGLEIPSFYHTRSRYMFLTYNPNQLMAYIILYTSSLIFIDINFFRNSLKWDVLLMILLLLPMLFTGSRTGLASLLLLMVLVSGVLIIQAGLKTRLFFGFLSTALVIMVIGYLGFIDKVDTGIDPIDRAVNGIIYVANGNEAMGEENAGATGLSIKEGMQKFSENKLLGVGLGNMILYTTYEMEVHNSYVSILSETGLLGMIGFLILIFVLFYNVFTSKMTSTSKLFAIGFYALFLVMNIPHILTRQRWTWVFFILTYVVAVEAGNKLKEQNG